MVRVLAGRGAREDVEELTADVFLALWAHAGELDPEQGLRPWLGAVARNRAMGNSKVSMKGKAVAESRK